MVATKLMDVRLTFIFLVLISLLAFHECTYNNVVFLDISINGNELDWKTTPGNKIKVLPCTHGGLLANWCCMTLKREACWDTQAECLAHCPPIPPSQAVP
ncbi:hypothetical protein GQ457_10G028220 [Hibiscus cannabinus]